MKNRRDFLKDVLKIGGVAAAISCGFSVDEIFAGQGMGPGPGSKGYSAACTSTVTYSSVTSLYGSGAANTVAASSVTFSTGRLVVIGVSVQSPSVSSISVTDSGGVNSYIQIGSIVSSSSGSIALFYVKNANGLSNGTITATFDTSYSFRNINVLIYDGASTTSPLDDYKSATATSSTPQTPALTTTCSNNLIVMMFTPSGGLASYTPESSPLQFTDRSDGKSFLKAEDCDAAVLKSVGTYTPTATLTASVNWAAISAAFK